MEYLAIVLEGVTTYGERVRYGQSLAEGQSFQFAPLLGGYYRAALEGTRRIHTNTPQRIDRHTWISLAPGEAKNIEIDPPQDRVQLSVRLTDSGGRPTQRGWLRLQTCPDGQAQSAVNMRYQAEVDGEGVVQIPNVQQDVYAVSAWCGQAGLMIQDRLDLRGKSGEVTTEFKLDPGVSIHGRVVDQGGAGVADTFVLVWKAMDAAFPQMGRPVSRIETMDQPGVGSFWTTSSNDGHFELPGLDNRSRYELVVYKNGHRSGTTDIIHPSIRGLTIPVTIRPPDSWSLGSFPTPPKQPQNDPPAPAEIELEVEYIFENSSGKPLSDMLVHSPHHGFMRTDEEGRLHCTYRLDSHSSSAGPWRMLVSVHEPGYLSISNRDLVDSLHSIDCTRSGSHTVKVVQYLLPVIAGKVVDTRGLPVASAEILIHYENGAFDSNKRGGQSSPTLCHPLPDGQFILEAKYPAKTAYLSFQKPGYARRWFGPLLLEKGHVVHGLELVVEESEGYEVSLRDRYGIPIVGAGASITTGITTPEGELTHQYNCTASDRYGLLRIPSAAEGDLVQRLFDERNASGGVPVILKAPGEGPNSVLDPVAYPEIALKTVDSNGKPVRGIEVRVSDDIRNWGILEKARRFLLGPRRRMTSGGGGTRRAKSDQDGIVRFWFDPRARVKIRIPKVPDRNGVRSERVDDGHYTLGEITIPPPPGS